MCPSSHTAREVVDVGYREHKARLAKVALDRYEQDHDRGADTETLMVDFLADLMHLAAMEGKEFDDLCARAAVHYEAERRGDA